MSTDSKHNLKNDENNSSEVSIEYKDENQLTSSTISQKSHHNSRLNTPKPTIEILPQRPPSPITRHRVAKQETPTLSRSNSLDASFTDEEEDSSAERVCFSSLLNFYFLIIHIFSESNYVDVLKKFMQLKKPMWVFSMYSLLKFPVKWKIHVILKMKILS